MTLQSAYGLPESGSSVWYKQHGDETMVGGDHDIGLLVQIADDADGLDAAVALHVHVDIGMGGLELLLEFRERD